MKDLLWAAGIGLALLFLLIGLVAASFTSYHGDRERPVMNLRTEKEEPAAGESAAPAQLGEGLHADGTLHPLVETGDAGEDYLNSLTVLCDSSMASLRSAGLCFASIWSSETGTLAMNDTDNWTIRYPGDGSQIGPASAALIAKPKILIISVGSDGLSDLSKEIFVENYEALIRAIASASPKTTIVCLSPCSVTAAYAADDGLSKEKAAEVNGWIKTVCVDTGAYYADLTEVLCTDGYLRDEYADGSGRALNNTGLREVLNFLRDHSTEAQ